MDSFKDFNLKFKEHDIVISIDEIGNIPKGTKGCIVNDYKNDNYEVEFFSGNKTLSVVYVNKKQIKKDEKRF